MVVKYDALWALWIFGLFGSQRCCVGSAMLQNGARTVPYWAGCVLAQMSAEISLDSNRLIMLYFPSSLGLTDGEATVDHTNACEGCEHAAGPAHSARGTVNVHMRGVSPPLAAGPWIDCDIIRRFRCHRYCCNSCSESEPEPLMYLPRTPTQSEDQ